MSKVLITGSGFIGTEIAKTLKEHEVVVYSIPFKKFNGEHIKFIYGDIFDNKNLKKVIENSDAIVHAIGYVPQNKAQENPQLSFELNIRSVQEVLESMRSSKVKKFILLSSSSVYGIQEKIPIREDVKLNLVSTYSFHKFIAEKLVECYSLNYGIKHTILRIFNVYGKDGNSIINLLIEKAKNNETIFIYGEEQIRDFVHVKDVATVVEKILKTEKCNGKIINVGSGVGRSISEVVNLINEHFPNLKIKRKKFKGKLYNSVADISLMKSLLDFVPDNSNKTFRKNIEELIR